LKAVIGMSVANGDQLGSAASGLFASDKPDESLNPNGLTSEGRQLLQLASTTYRAHYGKEMSAAVVSGFVGGWILFHDILPRAASMSQADVWKAAMSLDIPQGSEINGAGVRFSPAGQADAGQNERASAVIWEWFGVGHPAVVYPPPYATAAPEILPVAY
jgi:hypothetical protein